MGHGRTINLHEGWTLREDGTDQWMPARVPGTVLTALLDNGRIEDPYVGRNNLDCLWVEKRTWWYRTEFEIPRGWADLDLMLQFAGLDYAARVTLNGTRLGEHIGMFGGPDLGVSQAVRRDGPNELLLEILPPPTDWRDNFKANVLYGWHYGRAVSSGPWQAIRLIGYTNCFIGSASFRLHDLTETRAVIRGEVEVDASNATRGATVEVTFTGVGFPSAGGTSVHADLVAGLNTIPIALEVESPHLWWPHDLGDQPIYSVNSSVEVGDVPCDEVVISFGIREFDWLPTENKKEGDYDWILTVNRRKHFIKGANWSFTDALLRFSPEEYRYHLDAVRAAGINMLRVWGGGIVETELFYDICDELGILVWQEFPLSHPQTTDTFKRPSVSLDVIHEQATRIVRRLRNRPCLAMWCGGNEHGGKGDVIDALETICGDLDPTRVFHRASPYGGDTHDWDVYHHRLASITTYTKNQGPFVSEYGLCTPPSMKSIAAFTAPGETNTWPPLTTSSFVHHMPEYGSSPDLIKMLRYASEYGDIQSVEQFVRYMQLSQAQALRTGIDHARVGMFGRTGGVAIYKFNDIAAGITWSTIDWHGRTKPAYHFVRRAYAPVRALAPYFQDNFTPAESFKQQVIIVNDGAQISGASLNVRLLGLEFQTLETYDKMIDIPGAGSTIALEIERTVPVNESGQAVPLLLLLNLAAPDGTRLSRSVYWYNVSNNGVAHHASESIFDTLSWRVGCLDRLPKTRLEVSPERGNHGERSVAVTIRNSGSVPAFLTDLDTEDDTVVLFEDGSFWMEAGEERVISGLVHYSVVDRKQIKITASAWNADAVTPVSCTIVD